jgi:hypothetical protein
MMRRLLVLAGVLIASPALAQSTYVPAPSAPTWCG